ncbi:conserved Plasmodium protein, unknown function [Plasmodium gallinaceum]|uniref:Uncharacterized protein n=1 Tax=Plasmodium gallinaceum TaxID=5849 RepID=A0A1J1GP91_PLAGA|nr:conserved Plasmodium protein, unknown function [Plasmodium gallinaceum]CRG94311.1 conserved Plasmodium protein, unknown function [Plasmodium gallinaceum]
MHNLLKNTLNFDNFKNIKLDLINKINSSDNNDYHEENEVFNFLRDKKFVSDELYFSKRWNNENVFSVKKELRHINNLKLYLKSIKNFSINEETKLNKSSRENKNVHERIMNFSSYFKNRNNDDIDGKHNIKNVLLISTLFNMGKNKHRLTDNMFRKTLYKKIGKNGVKKKNKYEKPTLKHIFEIKNNCKKNLRITHLNRINRNINVYRCYYKKYNIEKKYFRNKEIYLKQKIPFVTFTKKNKGFIKKGSNINKCEELIEDRKSFKRKEHYSNDKDIPLEKKNYLNSSLNTKEYNRDTIKEIKKNMKKYEKNYRYDRVKNSCKGGYLSNLKFLIFNKECKDGTIIFQKKNIKSDELKKNNQYFKITKFDGISKTSSNLKNINLSIFRRMSTNNQYKNKREVKRNKDLRSDFHSNNINFYETLIKREKYKEESRNKDFLDKSGVQNNGMKEIKEKIQKTLISLNNIKKNNYKLKFCLEKEIIDNTIHHNELKKSICSLFNENILHRKNVEARKSSPKEKIEMNESNRNLCNESYIKVIKESSENVDNDYLYNKNCSKNLEKNTTIHKKKKLNVFLDKIAQVKKKRIHKNCDFYDNSNDKKKETTLLRENKKNIQLKDSNIIENFSESSIGLVNNTKEKRDILSESKSIEFSGIKHTSIKREESIKNFNRNMKLLDSLEKQYLPYLNFIKLNNKKERKSSTLIRSLYENPTNCKINSKVIEYDLNSRDYTLGKDEDIKFFEEKKNKINTDFNKDTNLLNTKKLRKRNHSYKSLLHCTSLKGDIIDIKNKNKVNNSNFVTQEKSNILKNLYRENVCRDEEMLNRNFSKNFKDNIKKEVNNKNHSEMVEMMETYKQNKCLNDNDNSYSNDEKEFNEQIRKNNEYKRKIYKKEYLEYENKQLKSLNEKKDKEDNIHINNTINGNMFNGIFVDNKKANYDVNSNIFVENSVNLEQFFLNKAKKEKKDFALEDVRNIKKIINCEIYVNEKFERIHNRNKIAINIIENYLEKRKREYSDFPKEKNNIYLQKNNVMKNLDEKKNLKFLPGLYEHYAFLLLNFRN